MRGYFITGTDTGCGKTEITLGLMRVFQKMGYSVLGMKPVASGAFRTSVGLRNDDALKIQRQGSAVADYDHINPFVFEPPIAPHLAAAEAGCIISVAKIVEIFERLHIQSDLVIVEGVGGWCVPLSQEHGVEDLARALGLPVILVVGLRLGCINHALLSARAIIHSGCRLAGWVANCLDPGMLAQERNLDTLERLLPSPLLGVVSWMGDRPAPELIASKLSIAQMGEDNIPSPLAIKR
ncbi:MAG: dethiobiotin synthase [Gammaproteobacteria bacterium]|nr:dethiobiotin synthase [Gammaproteobacteria bacterium]